MEFETVESINYNKNEFLKSPIFVTLHLLYNRSWKLSLTPILVWTKRYTIESFYNWSGPENTTIGYSEDVLVLLYLVPDFGKTVYLKAWAI